MKFICTDCTKEVYPLFSKPWDKLGRTLQTTKLKYPHRCLTSGLSEVWAIVRLNPPAHVIVIQKEFILEVLSK